MNRFYRQSISEYRRQISLKEAFAIQTERLQHFLETFDAGSATDEEKSLKARLQMIFPLIETAWADGRVTRREADAILDAAEAYGLLEDDTRNADLFENLTARPMPQTIGRAWQDFRAWFEKLSEFERESIAHGLEVQTRYVAEQSSDNLLAFLQGVRVSRSETETLRSIERQLGDALAAARANDEKSPVVSDETAAEVSIPETSFPALAGDFFDDCAVADYGKLIPLVPLVKTAWAEGRVTKRERHLVFEAARRMGVLPGTAAYEKLSEWLELHPTQEFYDAALETLNEHWRTKESADEASRQRFDVLSECTRVAEASGGTKDYKSGGARICDEEVAAVKYIARKLNTNRAALILN